MADFNRALSFVLRHEGAYSVDPYDAGGETYRGISRAYHPGWDGWDIIDGMREREGFPGILSANTALEASVAKFYKVQFWLPVDGDDIPDQGLAEELLDSAVNLGAGRAIRFLQRSLNALNRNEALYSDVREDGILGEKTRLALREYRSKDPPGTLLTCLNILQGMHYLNRLKERPDQERFARGWLSRVAFVQAS